MAGQKRISMIYLTGRSRALGNVVEESLDRTACRPFGAEPRFPLDPPKLAEQLAGRVAGARALDLRAYDPVAAIARDRHSAKLRDEHAADGVGQIGADAGLEPELHGSVRRKGSGCARRRGAPRPNLRASSAVEHRIRNAFAAVPAGDGPFRTVLFSFRILAGPSITSRLVWCAATELGSKMVARRSVFVR